jgi:hypothetical protein
VYPRWVTKSPLFAGLPQHFLHPARLLLPSLSGSVLDVGCCFQPAASPRAQPRFRPQTLDFRLWTRRGRKGTAETRGTQPGTTPQTKAGGINLGILEIRGKQTSSPFAFRVFRVFRGSSPSLKLVAAGDQLPLLPCRATQRKRTLCVSQRLFASLR